MSGERVVLDVDDRVKVRGRVKEYGGLEGQVVGIERDEYGFPTYWVYLERLTAVVKLQMYELAEMTE